ncbi:MAG TPA: molybdopterin oxidoreductase, partial [Thermoanaerobaculia bacterium]|nr:molybdopterin oxidoreductase [Thermoanaerobaculia bacterium]
MSEDARTWQGLDELSRAAPAPGRDKEFPGGKTLWEWIGEPSPAAGAASVAEGEGETRRDVLKMMGFSLGALATAGALGCRIPERRALPLVSEPEELVPGVADFYATTCGGCAAGCGLLVKVRDGRPIKIEGNPDSPLSGGGTCARGQATVLSLYDEQRFKGPTWLGQATSWTEIDAAVSSRLAAVAARGHGIVLLTTPGLGPSFRRLIAAWQERFPGARHRVHEAISLSALAQANERSFGLAVVPRYRLDLARLVVALDADFLGTWLSPVEHTRGYTAARRVSDPGVAAGAGMLRHVQVESQMSLTGSNADLRLAMRPSEIGLAALSLLQGVARRAGAAAPNVPAWSGAAALEPVAADLWAHRGTSIVLAGENDPALQVVVNRINALLGNVGRTIDLEHPSRQSAG